MLRVLRHELRPWIEIFLGRVLYSSIEIYQKYRLICYGITVFVWIYLCWQVLIKESLFQLSHFVWTSHISKDYLHVYWKQVPKYLFVNAAYISSSKKLLVPHWQKDNFFSYRLQLKDSKKVWIRLKQNYFEAIPLVEHIQLGFRLIIETTGTVRLIPFPTFLNEHFLQILRRLLFFTIVNIFKKIVKIKIFEPIFQWYVL